MNAEILGELANVLLAVDHATRGFKLQGSVAIYDPTALIGDTALGFIDFHEESESTFRPVTK